MDTKVIVFCVTVLCLQVGVTSKKKSTTNILTKIISNTGDQVVENISTSNDGEEDVNELKDNLHKRNVEYNLNSYPSGLDLEYLQSLNYANDHPIKYLVIHDQGKSIPYTSDYTFGNYLKVNEHSQLDSTTNGYEKISHGYTDYGASLDSSSDQMSKEYDPKIQSFLTRLRDVKILEVSTTVPPESESEYEDYEDSTEDSKLQLIAYIPSKAKFEESDDKLKRSKQTTKSRKKIVFPISATKNDLDEDESKQTKLHIVAYVPTQKKSKTQTYEDSDTSSSSHAYSVQPNSAVSLLRGGNKNSKVQFFINVPSEVMKETSNEQNHNLANMNSLPATHSYTVKQENNEEDKKLDEGTKLRIIAYVPKKSKLNQNGISTSPVAATIFPTRLYAVKQETSEEILNPYAKGIGSLGQNIKIVSFVPKKALFRQPTYNVNQRQQNKQAYSVHQDLSEEITTKRNLFTKLSRNNTFFTIIPMKSSSGVKQKTNLNNKGPVPFVNDYTGYQIDGQNNALKGINLEIVQPNYEIKFTTEGNNNTSHKLYAVQESGEANNPNANRVFLRTIPYSPNQFISASPNYNESNNLLNQGPVPFTNSYPTLENNKLSNQNNASNADFELHSIAYLPNSIVTESPKYRANEQNKGEPNYSNDVNQNTKPLASNDAPGKFIYGKAVNNNYNNDNSNLQNTGPVPFVDANAFPVDQNPTNNNLDLNNYSNSDDLNKQPSKTGENAGLHEFLKRLREENAARIKEYMKLNSQLYIHLKENFDLQNADSTENQQDSVADSNSYQSQISEQRVRPNFETAFNTETKTKIQPLNTNVQLNTLFNSPNNLQSNIMQNLSRNKSETPLNRLLFNAILNHRNNAQILSQNLQNRLKDASQLDSNQLNVQPPTPSTYQNSINLSNNPLRNRFNFVNMGRSNSLFEEENALIQFLTGGRAPLLNPLLRNYQNNLHKGSELTTNNEELVDNVSQQLRSGEENALKNHDADFKKLQEQAQLRAFLEKLREDNARKVNDYMTHKQSPQVVPNPTFSTNHIISTERTDDENSLSYNENGILYDKFKNQITPETTNYHYLNDGKIPFFNHYAFGDIRKLKNTTLETSVLENQRIEPKKVFESVTDMMKMLAKEIAQLLQKTSGNEIKKEVELEHKNKYGDNKAQTTKSVPDIQENKLHDFLRKLREENELKVKKFVNQQITSNKDANDNENESGSAESYTGRTKANKDFEDEEDGYSKRNSPFRFLDYRQFEEMERLRKQHESMFQDFFKKLRKDNEVKIDEFINGYMSHKNKSIHNEMKNEDSVQQKGLNVDQKTIYVQNGTQTQNKTTNETLSIDEIKQKVVFLVIPNFQLFQPQNGTTLNQNDTSNQPQFAIHNQTLTNSNHTTVKYTDILPFVGKNSSITNSSQQNHHLPTQFNYKKKNATYLLEAIMRNQTYPENDVNLSIDSQSDTSGSFPEEETTTKLFASEENLDENIDEDYQDPANIFDETREGEIEVEAEKKKKLVCVKNCAIINGGYYTYRNNGNQAINQVPPPNLAIPHAISNVQLPHAIPNVPLPHSIPNVPLPHTLPRLPIHPTLPQAPINPQLINNPYYPLMPPRFAPNQLKHAYQPFPYTVNRPYPNSHNMFDYKTWHHVNEDPDTDESFIHKLLYKYLRK